MRAAAQQQQQAPAAQLQPLPGPKAHASNPPAVIKAKQSQAAPLANGDASHAECSSPDETAAMREPGSSYDAEDSSTPLHWQAAEGSGLVSIAAVGLAKVVLAVTAPGGSGSGSNPAHMQQPPGGGDGTHNARSGNAADSKLTLEWALGSGAGEAQLPASGLMAAVRAAGDTQHLRCCMSAVPAVPGGTLRTLEAMAGVQLIFRACPDPLLCVLVQILCCACMQRKLEHICLEKHSKYIGDVMMMFYTSSEYRCGRGGPAARCAVHLRHAPSLFRRRAGACSPAGCRVAA